MKTQNVRKEKSEKCGKREICQMREMRQMGEMVNMRMQNDKRGKWEIKRNQKM